MVLNEVSTVFSGRLNICQDFTFGRKIYIEKTNIKELELKSIITTTGSYPGVGQKKIQQVVKLQKITDLVAVESCLFR